MSRQPSDSEWREGWPVVAAGAIGIGFGPGLFQYLSSLFTPGMAAEFGWTRGEIATAAGGGLLGALLVPLLGRAVDRLGVRPMIAAAMVGLGLAYLCFAAMPGNIIVYQLLISALALTVPGTSAVAYGKLIGARFHRHRGLALGIATSGISLASLAVAPALESVIAARGWRAGFVALAVVSTVVALPAVLLLTRGARATAPVARPGDDGPSASAVRRSASFRRLAGCGALVTLATVGLVTQLVPFGLDRGLTQREAALLLTSFAASQIAGRVLIGWAVDRFPPERTAAAVALVSAAAFAALTVDRPGFAAAAALVFLAGLMHGAEFDLLPFFAARLFGLRAYGEVYGTIVTATLIGGGAGVIGFGRLRDATGGYGWALALASGALALAAAGFLTLGGRAEAAEASKP